MDKSRSYILDRVTSRKTSIEEFNFDMLQAPPLGMFFDLYDIQELNSIAKSIRYSGKPEARYAAIDRVCKRRGLIKFGAGTNRVVYRHPEFPDIVFKIAADNIGLGDNPAEFRNQFILKPFVCKIFEVTPCGTVALVERVNPITSREEFISVADDVFTLITDWLIGEYILADIGALYYMNVGIRRNFGVVLLDYPYLYKLDGNKLFCKRKDPTSPTGTCDGVIDYDNAFSHLVCTKCGAKYKAKELEQKMKACEITTGVKEKSKMKLKIYGGDSAKSNKEKEVSFAGTDKFASEESSFVSRENKTDSVPASSNTVRVSFGKKSESGDSSYDGKFKVKSPSKKPSPSVAYKPEDKYVNGVVTKRPVVVDEFEVKKEEAPVEEKPVETPAPDVEEPVVVEEKPVVEDAIKISEAIKEEAVANAKPVETKGPAQIIDEAVESIEEQLGKIDIDMLKEDCIYRLIDIVSKHVGATSKAFKLLMSIAKNIVDDIDNYDNILDSDIIDIFTTLFKPSIKATIDRNELDGLDISCDIDIYPAWEDESEESEPIRNIGNEIIELEDIKKYFVSNNTETSDEVQIDKERYAKYHAKMVVAKTLFPGTRSKNKIIVMMDDNDKYLTVDGKIVAAEDIDDKLNNTISIVSSDWLNNLTEASNRVGASAPTAEEIEAAEESSEE